MSFLKAAWNKWLAIAKPIGNFQSQVILSVFYIVILLPVGLAYKFSDPLNMKKKLKSNFGVWKYPKDTLESAHRQY